jgi:hypothetical protein
MNRHINHHDTLAYGDRLRVNLLRIATSDLPEALQGALTRCAEEVKTATADMCAAMATHRSARSERRAAAEERLTPVSSARADLKAFALHLAARKADPHEAWNGDPALFIPGGLSSVKKGARGVRDAVALAHGALAAQSDVPERAKWLKRLAALTSELDALVERLDDTGHAHYATLSEQSDEKRAWMRAYRGAALVLGGVLTLTGRADEYTAAVPHLTAPRARRKAPDAPVGPGTPA